jgi:hypothetical protein
MRIANNVVCVCVSCVSCVCCDYDDNDGDEQKKTFDEEQEYDHEVDGEISMIQVVVDLFNEIMCTDCAEEEAMAKRLAAAAAHQPSPGPKRKRRPSTLSRRKFLSDAKERSLARSPSTTTAPPSQHLQVPERHAPPQVEQRREPEGEINYISADDILRGSGDTKTEATSQLPLRADGMYDAVPHAPHETAAPSKPAPAPAPTAVLAYDLLTDALAQSNGSVDEKGHEKQQDDDDEKEEETKDTRARAESESGLRPASSLLRGVQEYRVDVNPQGEQERSYDDVTDAFSAPYSPPPSISSSSTATTTTNPPRPIDAYNFEPSDDSAAEATSSSSSSSSSSSPPTAARDVYNVAVGGYNAGGATASAGPVSRRTGLGVGAAAPIPTVSTATATATATATSTTAGASAAPPGEQRESKFWDEAWKQAFEDKFSLGLDSVEKSKGRYSLGHPQCLANEVRAHGPLFTLVFEACGRQDINCVAVAW